MFWTICRGNYWRGWWKRRWRIRRTNRLSLQNWSWRGNRHFEQIKAVHRGCRFSSFNVKADTHYRSERKRDEMRQSWINNLFKQQWMWTCYVVKKILKLVMMLNISVWHLNISDFNNSCVSPFLLFFPKIVLI